MKAPGVADSGSLTIHESRTPPNSEKSGRFDLGKAAEGRSAVFAKPSSGQGKKRPPRSKDVAAKPSKDGPKTPAAKESPKKPNVVKEELPPPLSAALSQEAWQKAVEARLKMFCTKNSVDGTFARRTFLGLIVPFACCSEIAKMFEHGLQALHTRMEEKHEAMREEFKGGIEMCMQSQGEALLLPKPWPAVASFPPFPHRLPPANPLPCPQGGGDPRNGVGVPRCL